MLSREQVLHNQIVYDNGVRYYKIFVKPRRKILGYTFLTIGIVPNGLGWLCFPIGFMFLKNSSFKGLMRDIKTNLNKITIKIKRKIRVTNRFKYFKSFK